MQHTRHLLILVMAVFSPFANAQQTISLWGEETPPYSKPHSVTEYVAPCWGADCAYDVVDPTLTIFPAEGEGNGNIVLVVPGGGYDVVAIFHEGSEIAHALATRGTSAAVIKYRLPRPTTSTRPERVPLADLYQAMKLLRHRQAEFGISAKHIGVMGFSAGSHLATVASLNDAPEPTLKPDFSMLIYGVTKLTQVNLEWLEKSLYHRKLTEAEIAAETLLGRVSQSSPPAFLVHALDDDTCHYTESTLYAEALIRHGVEAEIHLFPRGGHGFGPGRAEDGTDQWLDLAANWLHRFGK
jgi:acetyl esterase/lipase